MDFSGVVNLSRRLLIYETVGGTLSGAESMKSPVQSPVRSTDALSGRVAIFAVPPAFETLRVSLSKTIGIVEFQILLSRALFLAKQETPWLGVVRVNKDASLGGLVEAGQLQTKDMAAQGCVVLLSHTLQLLMILVGEDLTLLLVRDALPDIPTI